MDGQARVDHEIRVCVPIWLDRAGLPECAEELWQQKPLIDDADMRSAGSVINTARTQLRAHRKRSKRFIGTATWDVAPAWDAAWNAGRVAGWEPMRALTRSLRGEISRVAYNLLLNAGHAARAAAWKVAWDAVLDDADDHHAGDVAWAAIKPIMAALPPFPGEEKNG